MISLIGIGSKREHITEKAKEAIKNADTIISYKPYLKTIEDLTEDKEIYSKDMGDELDRVELAIKKTKEEGKNVAIISSGDPGIYGMANVYFQIIDKYKDIEFEVIPGVTAATYSASHLGAPLHDLAIISLSNLLTPLSEIERKIEYAAKADLVTVFYNPKSKSRTEPFETACKTLLENKNPETPVGIVTTDGTDTITHICKLNELKNQDIGMSTTFIVGNSMTYVKKGKMITPRGYNITDFELPKLHYEFYEKFIKGDIQKGPNTDCEYFPCHTYHQNCTFCFCPFYPCGDGSTGGEWITDKDVWSCKNCDWLHQDEVVEYLLPRIKPLIETPKDIIKNKKKLLKIRREAIYQTRNLKYTRNYDLDED